MKISSYYKIHNLLDRGPLKLFAVNMCKYMRLRYIVVRMDTNFLCNLRCRTCYFSSERAKSKLLKPMELDLFKKIAQEVFPKTRVLFLSCGAEPFMTKNFDDYMDIAGQYNVPYIGLATNGILLNEKHVEVLIRNKVNELTISIDGATKETYESIRINGDFDRLVHNLKMFGEVKNRYKVRNPGLRFNFVMLKCNAHEMTEILRLAKSLGVSSVRFRHYTDWGGEIDFRKESLIFHPEIYNEMRMASISLAEELGIELLIPPAFENSESYNNRANCREVKPYVCIKPWFYLYIRADGKTRFCDEMPWEEGDLSKCSYAEIQKSERVKTRKKLLISDVNNSCLANVCNYESSVNDI